MGYEKRVKMSPEERAKQFLPFSAVRGLEEALERKRQELFVEVPHVLCPDAEEEINDTLNNLTKGDVVEVEFYDGVKNSLISGSVDSVRNKTKDIVVNGKVIRFEVIGYLKLIEKILFSDMSIVGSSRHTLKKSPLSFTILHPFLHVYITFSRSFSACMRSCDNLLG